MSEGRRYRVESVLGRGGFGTVYRAELTGPGGFSKVVALKVLNPDMEGVEEVARRFRDEARILGLIRHRAIVRVDGLVKLGGRQVVVMEFVEGVGLHQLVRDGVVPPGPSLEIVAEIAGALDVAYNHKGADGRPLHLLHRDLKPSNVQLTGHGEVKVLDFGIARADFDEREAQTRAMAFGSTQYMAPERFEMIDSHAGDIYALGAVLYELLAGQPFGKTVPSAEKHRKMLKAALEKLDQRLGVGVKGLGRLLATMLSYEAEDRPVAREVERTAHELRRELRGESLRDWAEHQVPLVVANWPAEAPAELSGSTLFETGATDAMDGSPSGAVPAPDAGVPASKPTSRPIRRLTTAPVEAPVAVPAAPQISAPFPIESQRREGTRGKSADGSKDGRSYAPAAGLAAGALGLLLLLAGALILIGAALLWWNGREVELEASTTAVSTAAASPTNAREDGLLADPRASTPSTTPPPSAANNGKNNTEKAATAKETATSEAAPKREAASQKDAEAKKAAETKAKAAAPSNDTPPAKAKAPTATSPPPTTTTRVSLTGDASRVLLRGAGKELSLQKGGSVELPAGSFALQADFGAGLLSAGNIRLPEGGGTATIDCDGGFGKCVSR